MQYNEVTPFQPTYRAYNKATRGFYGEESARLSEVTGFIYAQPRHPQSPAISYTLKKEGTTSYHVNHRQVYVGDDVQWKHQRFRYIFDIAYAPPAEWCVVDNNGTVLSKDAIAAIQYIEYREDRQARYERREAQRDTYEARKARLVYRKGSPKKIKATYRVRPYHSYWRGHSVSYHNEVRGYYRHPKNQRERAANYAHAHEYGEQLVRAHRRTREGLPSSWDDRSCSAWKTEDSWKHHSKRRKQWIPK